MWLTLLCSEENMYKEFPYNVYKAFNSIMCGFIEVNFGFQWYVASFGRFDYNLTSVMILFQ